MSAEHKAKIRDRRKPGWFRIDDEIVDVYGPRIGCHGIAVYAALSKYAGKDESSYPGLRLLCGKLKIGRKKLLDTLSKLRDVGLIEIEPGGRTHVNVYTLLDVPKHGGSGENQVVLSETTGGSGENQGGSETHDLGGSNENRNQTHKEPNPINQSSRDERDDESSIPDDTTAKCLLLLKRVENFPRDQAENALYLAELRTEFPSVDAAKTVREYQVWHRDNPGKTKNYRSRLRNFFASAANRKPDNVRQFNPPPSSPVDEDRKHRVRAAMGME